jgi:glycosyltransferase involved in cell wall biosynthesis
MVPNITLSILIPTYRRSDCLKQCMQSIVDSKLCPFEVVVGDDGGDEETKKVCKSFADILPVIYLPPDSPKGSLPSNLSRLIVAGRGDWMLLLHDDDFLTGDHSNYPAEFANSCDFYFTDHWIADETGVVDERKSKQNSLRYGRTELKEGLQHDVFDLAFNHRTCLDGFYAKSSFVKSILPDPLLGSTSDYFWVFRLLNSGMRVNYSNKRTFAYRISVLGITSSGFDSERILNGYMNLSKDFPEYNKMFNKKISNCTWYAINQCLRKGQRQKAWEYIRSIKFRYEHSIKHQFLLIIQLLWLTLPSSLMNNLVGTIKNKKFKINIK